MSRSRTPLSLAAALVLLAVSGCERESNRAADPVPRPAFNPELDAETGLALAAFPLACLDRPHGPPRRGGYLFERTVELIADHESKRAFYGCFDWHSAVNSTWAMVELLDRFPSSPVAPLIAEKLGQHLAPGPMAGEMAFFTAPENRSFERPYGWAWFLGLHAALLQSGHPAAGTWSEATAPLAALFAEGLRSYFDGLDYPMRVGTHANTAFALDLALDYALVADVALAETIQATAVRLFGDDVACPLGYEPSASDFLSPCLEEGKLMARILDADSYVAWHDAFMPPTDSPGFRNIADVILLAGPDVPLDTALLGAKSHLIGLAFTRAEGLQRIAGALPPDDARVASYRAAAAEQAGRGLAAMFDADYLGSHWLGTFALRYLVALDRP